MGIQEYYLFNNIYIIDAVLLTDYCFYILFVSLTFYEHIAILSILIYI